MTSEDSPGQDDAAPAARRRGPSRRQFVVGAAIGVAAVAGGAVAISRIPAAPTGELVSELLRTPAFTVAHRGGSADWPEMSMFAYRQAVAAGVNALEISLARTSDGVWFGLHDATLDRTSGTAGFVASEHSWAEISSLRITAAHTTDLDQPTRPYLRFEDLVEAYARTHTIFVDPKVVRAQYFPELLGMMDSLVPRSTQSFIAKGYCTSTPWADAARARGYRGWGFYYGSTIDADPEVLRTTQAHWSMLGLDYDASDAAWAALTGHRKKVLGHIIATKSERRKALAHGAAGLVVSGITEVLG
jgi:hypothetical protein